MIAAPKGGPALVASQDVAHQDAVLVGLAPLVAADGLGQAVGGALVAVGIGRADEVGVDRAQVWRDGNAATSHGQTAVRGARETEGRVGIAGQDFFRSQFAHRHGRGGIGIIGSGGIDGQASAGRSRLRGRRGRHDL